VPPELSRHKRIVTFVTDADNTRLERMAEDQGKSLSAVVYEILAGYLDQTGQS
jgi:hypothetical protein